jgi:prophage regulatory protein
VNDTITKNQKAKHAAPPELWRFAQVARVTGLSRPELYRLMQDGKFPKPVTLTASGRGVGWVSNEIVGYINSRIKARDDAAAA